MTSRIRGSPIIKTVFQPKRKLLPVVAPSSTSEWSTIGQHTTTGNTRVEYLCYEIYSSDKSSVGLLKQDWSEDDDDTDSVEEYDNYR